MTTGCKQCAKDFASTSGSEARTTAAQWGYQQRYMADALASHSDVVAIRVAGAEIITRKLLEVWQLEELLINKFPGNQQPSDSLIFCVLKYFTQPGSTRTGHILKLAKQPVPL
jgi:hypothetical protein